MRAAQRVRRAAFFGAPPLPAGEKDKGRHGSNLEGRQRDRRRGASEARPTVHAAYDCQGAPGSRKTVVLPYPGSPVSVVLSLEIAFINRVLGFFNPHACANAIPNLVIP